ncbi:acetyl-CoA synthetase-like protein, partial [Roridomyces roridus]
QATVMSRAAPPLDFSLTLDGIIDFHISTENQGIAYSFADGEGHIIDITRFEFARAAHRVAHLLRPQRRGPDRQTLGIIAMADSVVYQTVVAGCIKAGIVPFPISHRNSREAILHLLNATNTRRLLMTKASLSPLEDTMPYVEEMPVLGQIYPHFGRETPQDEFIPYPDSLVQTSVDDVAIYLHSSGNTGLPKLIPMTHKVLIQCLRIPLILCSSLRRQKPTCNCENFLRATLSAHVPLPSFHVLGITVQLLFPIVTGGTVCIFPPASTGTEYLAPILPTADNTIAHARHSQATGLLAAPTMIAEWSTLKESVAYLKTLEIVTFGGAPLAEQIGDELVAQGVNLVLSYGGTEFGPVDVLKRRGNVDASDWSWIQISQGVRVRWVSQGDETFECQFLVIIPGLIDFLSTIPETPHLAVENLPDTRGYATKDLFRRHPTNCDLVGRLDDVVIMANGEKTVPGPMEDIILSSPFIRGAVMFGRERNQVGVLVEPHGEYQLDPSDREQLASFRNLIWPAMEVANKNAPSFAKIYHEMILVTLLGKPMVRAAKGTVIRKATIGLYEQEIEALYATIENSGDTADELPPPTTWTPEDLEPWLKAHASLISNREICVGDDLFVQHGFDSLSATFLRHRIVGALRRSEDVEVRAAAMRVGHNIVYAFPSIRELARAVGRLVQGGETVAILNRGEHKAAIEAMVDKYSPGFETPIPQAVTRRSVEGVIVLLTGTTGALGSHILAMLLESADVARVYAFNRRGSSPASKRQTAAFIDCGLEMDLLSSDKLVYLEGDTAESDLGLPTDVLTELRETLTILIHNAWMLDFNKPLSSFESHVKGTRNLIDLARSSAASVRFLFTSSIASAQGWAPARGLFPEELQLDAGVAVGDGYGESKYIAERILATSGLEATSFRIGQICGSIKSGAWSTTDWVPAIVKSSLAIGTVPSDPSSVVAWLPPEAVANVIVDTALSKERPVPFALNVVHPRPVPWDFVMSCVADFTKLPLTPFAEWMQKLRDRESGATVEDLEDIPALKLLGFLNTPMTGEGDVGFDTTKAQELSRSIRVLAPLEGDDVRRWMKYWQGKKFIESYSSSL